MNLPLPTVSICQKAFGGGALRQVAAAVIIEEGRLFIARRAPGEKLAGCWELPGGKLEDDETPQRCVERELIEELGMSARADGVLASSIHTYEHGAFEVLAVSTTRCSTFRLTVHDQRAWVKSADIESYDLAPADIELVAALSAIGVF